jgi:hypothetical protein
MKIEAGKYYRTRGGIIYGPMIRVSGKIRLPFRVENVALDWREDGFFQSDQLESEHDLISQVYVSDTPPVLANIRTGSSGGGGGMTPDTPRVGFAPPDQRQTADAPAPEAKTLRDEFAMAALTGFMADPNVLLPTCDFSATAEGLYAIADAMMEERKK